MLQGLVTVLFISFFTNAHSFYSEDAYRAEVREMTLENHQNLQSYRKARKDVMQNLHLRKDNNGHFVKDVYCNIKFRHNIGPSSMPKHTVINIEHTWPRSRFGVSKGSYKFRVMEADLHHLYPTETKSNSTRGNFVFTDFKGAGEDISKKCTASQAGHKPGQGRAFEPPHEHKGNVARALFYMAVRYDLKISKSEEFFLRQWHLIDPVDDAEIKRNDDVEKVQGNRNPFTDEPDLVNLITNF